MQALYISSRARSKFFGEIVPCTSTIQSIINEATKVLRAQYALSPMSYCK